MDSLYDYDVSIDDVIESKDGSFIFGVGTTLIKTNTSGK